MQGNKNKFNFKKRSFEEIWGTLVQISFKIGSSGCFRHVEFIILKTSTVLGVYKHFWDTHTHTHIFGSKIALIWTNEHLSQGVLVNHAHAERTGGSLLMPVIYFEVYQK